MATFSNDPFERLFGVLSRDGRLLKGDGMAAHLRGDAGNQDAVQRVGIYRTFPQKLFSTSSEEKVACAQVAEVDARPDGGGGGACGLFSTTVKHSRRRRRWRRGCGGASRKMGAAVRGKRMELMPFRAPRERRPSTHSKFDEHRLRSLLTLPSNAMVIQRPSVSLAASSSPEQVGRDIFCLRLEKKPSSQKLYDKSLRWQHQRFRLYGITQRALKPWGISIANVADFAKPPEKISYPQQVAVTCTGLIWSRYSTVITPKNWNLFSVNVAMAGTGIYQLARKIRMSSLLSQAQGHKTLGRSDVLYVFV
ncbi:hypothetical protein MUK42_17151 [Musa troglodytarum]|uniref:Mitochondrial pyruvate carrier n=1 Tax=Musa troglodytarum TaxID=320322 RepID=A0A9E7L0M9_9LILI|nr:hypothetical protein MUK42_17151 [Musa troglodytarum]